MTADLYATAAGLIERSAAAYVSGIPEAAADDGPLGPASVAWRVSTDLASPVAGLRSLLMQALHPLAMAGVGQPSGWRRDPVGRLAATSAYLTTARGRTLTSYHTLQNDLRNAGATWANREVVVHGNLVTGRQPSDVPAFTREMLNLFAAARGA